ncbi:single-stranded DNA-binding protein [Paenibacillus massiliensis]|uniref:single-stranded DNA-binding protein n=1 Tax=Paenibacillus massiliensis TaxID=225917 RepID=UPI00042A112D|nr:single-stranded DNA-binding protein [Paenibacillus massiliensis]
MSINRVVLVGRLTKDPELRYSPIGTAVTNFTLAVDRAFKSQDGQDADFIPVVVFKQAAEASANYLSKGRLVGVEGRIQVRSYEDDEGRRRYVTEVVADNVRFLESSRNDRRQGDPNDPPARQYDKDPFKDDGKPIDIDDDSLPF